ncbi:tryptophan synthase subunit beta [Pisolithus tinctorius]|uniref:Uncharacterized protein n=1 Tax=Pisolithus tinctorius Marx 270 TaxID=870435 RepID=A0A0C3JBF4_PISTI|nr:tryptophan synthase subunit beta [Pisolithus tinctorius]KIO06408.1 hypothetical protein M404DRAFT_24639 [Pisolithus tinctorius Marx 270]
MDMGAQDARRQPLNVFRMKMPDAKVVPVESGSKTLKDAVDEATYFLIGSCFGPHPILTIIRDWQKVIGREIKAQITDEGDDRETSGRNCRMRSRWQQYHWVLLQVHSGYVCTSWALGQEARMGIDGDRHGEILARGKPGVLHGVQIYVLQDPASQIVETHSISAGLDYPDVGPEHSWLRNSGNAEYEVSFQILTRSVGAVRGAKTLAKETNFVIRLRER